MSISHYHDVFCEHQGEWVEITCHDGQTYHGFIGHVDDSHVYLHPQDLTPDGQQFGTFFFGAGLVAIALASIAAFSFSPFFW